MDFGSWVTFVGVLLIAMALGGSLLQRLPLSTSMLYLLVGLATSPLWLGWTTLTPVSHSHAIERLAEIVVLLSLFTSGLKMSLGLADRRWLLPLRLASVSMLVTVGLIAAAGVVVLGLPLGAAVLLGGILAPTDPVLASDVQVAEPGDRDRLRFALTGEAGLNDGTAFPFVLLGLGLLGLHDIGRFGWRWLTIDVLWGVSAGIAIGAALGTLIGRLVIYLRSRHREAVGLDNFLALGLIGVSYGVASMAQAYGFLAVFAAGVALRRLEQQASASSRPDDDAETGAHDDAQGDTQAGARSAAAAPDIASVHADPGIPNDALAVDPERAPAFMAHAMLSFNEQLERIGEVAAVVAIGMLLWAVEWRLASWAFVVAMLVVIRPISVAVGLAGSNTRPLQRSLIGWFGIRGIGSLYYLTYAMNHGLDPALAATLAALTFSVVGVSIAVHGISVTPLMKAYRRDRRRSNDD